MTIASCFCWVRVLMYDTWLEALASDGPTSLLTPLNAPAASEPPLSAMVKYGLLICLGRNAIFSPSFSGAFGFAAAALLAAAEVSVFVSFLVVPPHAASIAPVRTTVVILGRRDIRKGFLPCGVGMSAGTDCSGRIWRDSVRAPRRSAGVPSRS